VQDTDLNKFFYKVKQYINTVKFVTFGTSGTKELMDVIMLYLTLILVNCETSWTDLVT